MNYKREPKPGERKIAGGEGNRCIKSGGVREREGGREAAGEFGAALRETVWGGHT